MIVFLARLIPSATSSSRRRGSTARAGGRVFRHVDVPQLVPAIVFFAIVETITMLSWVFAYIYVMTAGGPGNSTVVSEYYIYQQIFLNTDIGIGAAAAVSLLGVGGALIVPGSGLGASRWRPASRPPTPAGRAGARCGRPRWRSTSCCCAVVGLALLPIYFMVVNAFKTDDEYLDEPVRDPADAGRSRRSATRSAAASSSRWLQNSFVITALRWASRR